MGWDRKWRKRPVFPFAIHVHKARQRKKSAAKMVARGLNKVRLMKLFRASRCRKRGEEHGSKTVRVTCKKETSGENLL